MKSLPGLGKHEDVFNCKSNFSFFFMQGQTYFNQIELENLKENFFVGWYGDLDYYI